jgi:TonB family protein
MPALLLALLLAAAPETPATRAAPAMPIARYITDDDYPAAAIRAGEEGTVGTALDISPEGRVTACTITRSSRSAVLDSSTCRLLRARARFTPARDSSGRPVPDRFETAHAWRISARAKLPQALNQSMQAWIACLRPIVLEALATTPTAPSRTLAEQAFPACREPEDAMVALMVRENAATGTPEARRLWARDQFIASLEKGRSAQP